MSMFRELASLPRSALVEVLKVGQANLLAKEVLSYPPEDRDEVFAAVMTAPRYLDFDDATGRFTLTVNGEPFLHGHVSDILEASQWQVNLTVDDRLAEGEAPDLPVAVMD